MHSGQKEQSRMKMMMMIVSSYIYLEYEFLLSGGVLLVDGLDGP